MTTLTTRIAEYEQRVPLETKAQWSEIILVRNRWQLEALKAVLQISRLPSNWDSYGSLPLSEPALAASVRFLAVIDLDDLPVPFVVPVPGGGIQFEWIVGQRELELEILPDGTAEFLKVEREQPIEEGQLQVKTYGQVASLLSWLTSGQPHPTEPRW